MDFKVLTNNQITEKMAITLLSRVSYRYNYIHCDMLMRSQKKNTQEAPWVLPTKCTLQPVNDVIEEITQEAPMGASWVLPRKVAYLV